MTLVEHIQSKKDEWLKGFMAASYLYNHQLDEYQKLRDEYVSRKNTEEHEATDRCISEDRSERAGSKT